MGRCIGRNINLQRCQRNTDDIIMFCGDHKFQWLMFVISILAIIGACASIFSSFKEITSPDNLLYEITLDPIDCQNYPSVSRNAVLKISSDSVKRKVKFIENTPSQVVWPSNISIKSAGFQFTDEYWQLNQDSSVRINSRKITLSLIPNGKLSIVQGIVLRNRIDTLDCPALVLIECYRQHEKLYDTTITTLDNGEFEVLISHKHQQQEYVLTASQSELSSGSLIYGPEGSNAILEIE